MFSGRAIELDPKYVKAYYRRALCQLSILRPQLAVADFKKSLALDPQNKLARTQLDATTKHIRRLQFEAVRQNGTALCVADDGTRLLMSALKNHPLTAVEKSFKKVVVLSIPTTPVPV